MREEAGGNRGPLRRNRLLSLRANVTSAKHERVAPPTQSRLAGRPVRASRPMRRASPTGKGGKQGQSPPEQAKPPRKWSSTIGTRGDRVRGAGGPSFSPAPVPPSSSSKTTRASLGFFHRTTARARLVLSRVCFCAVGDCVVSARCFVDMRVMIGVVHGLVPWAARFVPED